MFNYLKITNGKTGFSKDISIYNYTIEELNNIREFYEELMHYEVTEVVV